MTPIPSTSPASRAPLRRLIALGLAFGLVLLSCGRDVTAPGGGRYASHISFAPVFPPAFQVAGGADVVAFTHVHIVLRHSDGTIALDQFVDFAPGQDAITLQLTVPLLDNAPASGEPMTLALDYLNASNQVVFSSGIVSVTAAPPAVPGQPNPPVSVPLAYTGPGATAASVVIATPTSVSIAAGGSFAFTATAKDGGGNTIIAPIIWTSSAPSIANVTSAAAGTGTAGSVRGSATITAQLLTGPSASATVNVTLPASQISIVSGGAQAGDAGATLPAPLIVKVAASDGVGVAGASVSFAVASGGGSVTNASATTDAAGLAQTNFKLGAALGVQTVTATSGSLSGSPLTFTDTARSSIATKLVVGTQPANTAAGATLPSISVVAQTSAGDTAHSFTGAVTLAILNGPAGSAITGTTTVNAVAGVAIFSGLQINKSGNGYILDATSSGLTDAPTGAFNITAAAASKLTFTTQPSSVVVGAIVGSLSVAIGDQFGNVATGFTGPVTLAIGANPGSSALGGTTTVNAVAGIATFANITLNHAGTAYTIVASAAGLTAATTETFNIFSGGAAVLVQSGGVGQSANINSALAQPIVVQVQDLGGNPVAGTTVTIAVATGGGSVSVTSGVSDAGGNVSTVWTLGPTVGGQTLTATSAGLSGSPLTINATGTVTLPHFVVTTQPGASQTAGVNVTPSVVFEARDPSNILISGFTGAVTLGFGANPGGATLSGTLTVNAVGGVATFSAFSLNRVGTGYTLTASAAGYTNAATTSFNIVAAAAASMAISGGNAQAAAPSAALVTPLSVTVTDLFGNVVGSRAITFAVASGGGSVTNPNAVTNIAGVAQTSWTLGATGAQSVTATSAGLAGSPLTFTATFTAGVASTTVAPKVTPADTIVSIGATTSLTATARDASSNIVAGSYTWVSRTPAVATVSNTGVVTAVANGGTWIVAIEAGSTKDSALVTVAQRLATINVTPGTKNIYLGSTFGFTAQAVDGLGVALAAQPSFTWSSTATGIATVNGSGLASTVALGSTQIRATSGAVIGVSSVTVVTTIKNIYVVRDSSGFSTTASDNFSMASLVLHRGYKAYAYDSTSTLVAGATFTWASSNSSVAAIDTNNTPHVDVVSVANGNAFIQATSQGVTGQATLTVAQVLASISVTPVSPQIQPTGSVVLTAHGKDANGQFISGGSFTWTSQTTSIATVNSSTGLVTGGATTGTDSITATSGAIHGAGAVIVANSVPAALSFSRDTVSVGRGSNTSVPILLSRPSATSTTLLLTVADTFAYWSPAGSPTATPQKVVVPANQTSVNATLNGHNAGNTTITVADSAGVYSSSTSVLAVQATMHLTTGSYALNATDQQSTQVVLSDPSPAGGTFVTFNYGTAGVASVSPSPAFIPQGQLAANIVINATAAGSTTITPVAIGVNGTPSSMTTYASNLAFSSTNDRLGSGQYDANTYIYTPTYSVNGVPLTITSSDTNIVTVTPAGSIPSSSYYFYFTTTAKAAGVATITVSSPGWTGTNSVTVRVTTPHVGISGGGSLQTTSPQQSLTVYAEDSAYSAHYRTSSLVVHLSSSDTTVMKVLDSVGTIAPGQYYVNGLRVIPGGAGGSAYIRVSAGGHTSDSTQYTVVGPKLEFNWNSNRVGLGQEDDNVYVYAPNNVASPLVVTLTADTTKTGLPATVTIPAGSYYAYFNVRGKALGTALPIVASAVGYQGDTSYYTVSTPRVKIASSSITLNNFSAAQGFTTYAEDSAFTAHYRTAPLVVSFSSSDTTIFKVDSATATIAAGIYYVNTMHVTAIGVGTAKLYASAAGHSSDSITVTVNTPQLGVNLGTYTLGRLQDNAPSSNSYVYVPDNRTSQLLVTATQTHPSVDSISATVDTIPNGTYYRYFYVYGKTNGIDTITFSAPGYLPVTAYVRVTTPHLSGSNLTGSVTTTNPPMSINVYAEDSLGTTHYTSDTVVVQAVSSDTTVLQVASPYIRILKGNYYINTTVNVIGPGTAHITYSDSAGLGYGTYTTNTVTVTGPALTMSNSSFMLGMRQNSGPNGVYVYAPNNVATPLVVTLTSSAPSVAIPTATTVTIPAGSYYAYFQVNALDTIGTIQITATATGYTATHTNVQVSAPYLYVGSSASANTTAPQQTLTVYAQDQNGTSHFTNENVSVTLLSTAPGIATIDSSTVTIVAGNYYSQTAHWHPVAAGSTQLQFSDARAVFYKYNTFNYNVTVNTPTLSFGNINAIGIGQYRDSYFYVQSPDNQAAPMTVAFSHNGTARSTLPASAVIGSGTYYSYFRIIGALAGTDTVVASATSPAHNPATAYLTVGNGRLDPVGNWPGSSVHVGDSVAVTMYARDPSGTISNVSTATTFTLAPNANIEFHSSGATITSVVIPQDAQSVTFYLKALSAGTGGATISNANYTSYSNTMTVIP